MIREYTPDDIIFIEQIGKIINKDYIFKINPYIKCFVYESDKIVVGFVVISMILEKAEIIDIAIKEDCQRQNIGSQLLSYIIQECIKNKCQDITLEVRAGNQKAINFYKKNGFRELTMRPNYYADGEDALVMIKLVL